jgi:tRNA-splicing ligase RtcB
MPDVHLGKGATIGSVIPTLGAIIPAAVGVDIGCGMMAVKTSLRAGQLPDTLAPLRSSIEKAVPHGRTPGKTDRGSWSTPPAAVDRAWAQLQPDFAAICARHPAIAKSNHHQHLSTLGTGNHFIEICLDESDSVWAMLHTGSRGVGNRIGTYFIGLAKKDMEQWFVNLPDKDLAYFPQGTAHFDDYVFAVDWAQNYARTNRQLMMQRVLAALRETLGLVFECEQQAVNCHHNYVQRENHYGKNVWLTRKGAVSARAGELGIIPGSMGACSYIVRGLGNPESFHSCSHGAGRAMSRTEAKKRFSREDHARATDGVECRKDKDVIDETPAAYKPIDAVMEAQKDLVEIVYRLKQIVCVKG